MAINDILEVKFFCYFPPQSSVNVRHYISDFSTPISPSAQVTADSFSLTASSAYKSTINAGAKYVGCVIRKLNPALPHGDPVQSLVGAGPGLVPGDALPTQVCGLITIRTATAGRQGRGRLYFPFLSETDNALGGVPTAGFVTGLQAVADVFKDTEDVLDGINSETWTPCVFRPITGLPRRVTAMIARARWATQRRRGGFGSIEIEPLS